MTEETINQMLTRYNSLVGEVTDKGGRARERRSFRDRSDAERSLEMMESTLRALRSAGSTEDVPTPANEQEGTQQESRELKKTSGTRKKYADDQQILPTTKANDRRGTAKERLEKCRASKTVKNWLKVRGNERRARADLAYFVKEGYVRVK